MLRGPAASRAAGGRPSRSAVLAVSAKLKYQTKIAQNHKQKSAWVNIDLSRLYTQSTYNPGRQVGPVRLQQVPGRGRGLVAEVEIPIAETLLVCEPVGAGAPGGPQGVGVLLAAEGRELLPEHLVHALQQAQEGGRLDAGDRARIRLLDAGNLPAAPETEAARRAAKLDDFKRMEEKLKRAADVAKGGVKKAKGKGFGAPAQPAAEGPGTPAAAPAARVDMAVLGEAQLSDDEMSQVVRINCWGMPRSEFAISVLRQEPSQAIVGLWPEFSLVNHSCAPNTVAFIVGTNILVQVVRTIPAGAEATASYLGELVLAPLKWRREWLHGSYGFTCECERCTAEEALPGPLASAVAAVYERASSPALEDTILTAMEKSDAAAVAPLRDELQGLVDWVERLMGEHGLEDQVRVWVRASLYRAYRMLAMLKDLPQKGGPPSSSLFAKPQPGEQRPFSNPEVPQGLAKIIESVAAGSDDHLFLAMDTLLRSAESFPRDDPRVGEATKVCLRAHLLRYGRVSDAVLQQLIRARSQTPYYLDRATQVSQAEDASGGNSGNPLLGVMRDAAKKVAEFSG